MKATMNRDKQIEEMAVEMGVSDCKKRPCKHCAVGTNCIWLEHAERLYNAGYRKAEDVTRGIFEEIEKSIASLEYRANTPRKTVKVEELKAQVNWVLHEVVPQTIAELKKKF